MPPAGAVRIEEMINYFKYDYPQPTNNLPFTINTEQSICPWNTNHQLILVGLQGKRIEEEKLPPASLTFLIDVSGSMYSAERLPLVKSSLLMLVDKLREQDRVAIVVYAGNAGLVLPSTSNKEMIKTAIEKLEAGGSTAGGQGIKLAYKTAKSSFIKGGNNRVILCTDGDFNVGASSDDELERKCKNLQIKAMAIMHTLMVLMKPKKFFLMSLAVLYSLLPKTLNIKLNLTLNK